MAESERIVKIHIEEEMKSAYIDYSMSVIVSRALPDVRDGLKPVHRRVLFGMQDLGVLSNRPYKKSARIVGEVLGKYHPHGDTSVYDAMVRMAQDWSLRYPWWKDRVISDPWMGIAPLQCGIRKQDFGKSQKKCCRTLTKIQLISS